MRKRQQRPATTRTSDERGRLSGVVPPETTYTTIPLGDARLLVRVGNPLATPSFRELASRLRGQLDAIDSGIPLGAYPHSGELAVIPITDDTRILFSTSTTSYEGALADILALSPRPVVKSIAEAEKYALENPSEPLPLVATFSPQSQWGTPRRETHIDTLFHDYAGPQLIIAHLSDDDPHLPAGANDIAGPYHVIQCSRHGNVERLSYMYGGRGSDVAW